MVLCFRFKLTPAEVRNFDCPQTPIGLGLSVVNLSHYDINIHESSVLEKGLKFVPYTQVTGGSIMDGFRDFSRKIKLSYFFHNKPRSTKHEQDKLYREKSSFQPDEKLLAPEIIAELENLRLKLSKVRITSEPPNMSTAEYTALDNLSKQTDIVFKKSDKSSAICIMSRQNYIDEALSQLNRDKYYEKIPGPIFQNTIDDVNEILEDLKNKHWLDQAQVNFLSPKPDARERVFYTLPKTHKKMEKWPLENKIPPGRPIVSDINSESYRYAKYIDDRIKPLADIHPSYIKNTYDLLDQLSSQEIKSDAFLVTFDVEALYTNIQPQLGIEALRKVYQRSGLFIPQFEQVVQLLEISLKNNDFNFGDQYFRQCFGTSMGKIYAPTYANIFMANWEFEIMQKVKEKPKLYKRFLDDGFMIWEGSKANLLDFLKIANEHDHFINLTWEIHETSCDFLDITIFKGNRFSHHNILDTKVYFKVTDTHELLDTHSWHPKHVFKGIVKSQLIRFRLICNNISDFDDATSKLFKVLREKRHYSARFLRKIKSDFLRRYHGRGDMEDPSGAAMKCNRKNCTCCLYMDETSYFDETEIPINGRMDCTSTNVIYVIECIKCKRKYVGETQKPLKTRLLRHISDIRTYKDTSVAEHFNYECISTHNVADLKIYPIEFIHDQGSPHKNEAKLLKRESYWIDYLETLEPCGLNVRKSCAKANINVSMTYSNTSSRAFKTMRESYDRLKTLFPKIFTSELVCSYKRSKNISEYLTRAKLK